MPDNFTDNPLAGFQQYRAANAARGNAANGSPYPAYTPADDAGNPLYKGIANTMPDGGFLQALRDDVAAGTLPQVSWIVAPATYSEHPGPSSPVQGAWYTQQVLDALTANPDVWSRTVLLINFDENDGFFDHCRRRAPRAGQHRQAVGYTSMDASPSTTASTRRRSAPARACRCTWCRRGAAAAGSTRRCSTTPRCCASSSSASAWRRPTSAPTAARSWAT
jgi:phospholipase C